MYGGGGIGGGSRTLSAVSPRRRVTRWPGLKPWPLSSTSVPGRMTWGLVRTRPVKSASGGLNTWADASPLAANKARHSVARRRRDKDDMANS